MSYYDTPTWSDFNYQERHGHLPDKGSSAEEMREYFGDPDGGDYDHEHVRDVMRAVGEESMSQRMRELEDENAALREELDVNYCGTCGRREVKGVPFPTRARHVASGEVHATDGLVCGICLVRDGYEHVG